MQQMITPVSGPIKARVQVPGSKSITNRALLLAALAEGISQLHNILESDDTQSLIEALRALGINIDLDQHNHVATVQGCKGRFPQRKAKLFCRDSGITTRFLLANCAAMDGEYHFNASARMSERPIAPLLKVLKQQGASFEFLNQAERLPLILHSRGLQGGEVEIDISQSSQFLSGLMIAAPFAQFPLRLSSSDLSNKPYITMTAAMMGSFGINAILSSQQLEIAPGFYHAQHYTIEPDVSTASYFWAIAAITGGELLVENVSRSSLQGDIKFLAVLEKMGCRVIEKPEGILVVGQRQLQGLGEINMGGFTDTFMTVAALAVFADRPTTIRGLAHTRLQESDRIAAMAEGLSKLGVQVEAGEDYLKVYPSKPHAGEVNSHGDHRIAMSLSLLGLKVPGVIVCDAEVVSKTCPHFFKLIDKATGI